MSGEPPDGVPSWGDVDSDTYAVDVGQRELRKLRPVVESTADESRPIATVSNIQGVHRTEWGPPIHVVIEIDHVHAERSGEVKGEVAVWSTARGRPELLHRSSLTLSGIRSRQDLAGYLAKRTPGERLDWPTFVETAAVETIGAFRRGDPAVRLRDLERPTAAGYILAPLVLESEPTIWFGDGGDGKSLLALAAAAAIASGRSDLLDGMAPTRPRRVLYADFEFSGSEHRDRLERLCGADMPDIVYVRCDAALTYEVDRLRRIVRDEGIEFLIIDSVAFACHDAPETSVAAQEFFRALRRIGLGALCIAHVTKAEAGDQKPFGSAFWHNGARSTWYVKRDGEGDRITLGMFNRKANTGPRSAAVGFEIAFSEDRGPIAIRRTDLADVAALADRLPLAVRIEHVLRAGALTYVEIASELGDKVDSVSKAVRRLEGKRFVRMPGPDGIYRVGLLSQVSA